LDISEKDLQKEFEIFIDALYDNNIKINVVSLTVSPAFFPEKYKQKLKNFYNTIKSASKNC